MNQRLLGLAALAASLAGASGIDARQRAVPAHQGAAGEPKSFSTTISGTRGDYTIEHGGTIDGENSRYPLGVLPPPQAFESNLSVTIENVGETDVVNPWLSNHRTTFRSSAELVASAIRPGMTDQEKALAIWWKAMSLRFHGDSHEEEDSPMRVLHGYGFNTCGGMTAILMQLWRHAGLQSRMNVLPFHVVGEVKYEGAWHVLDGDLAGQYYLHDNETVASFYQLGRDHDLIRRGHTFGMLEEVGGQRVGSAPPLYSLGRLFTIRGRHLSHDDLHLNSWVKSFDKTRRYRGVSLDDARVMNMTLRPGERLTYRWESAPRDRVLGAEMSGEGTAAVALVTNGLWEYRPRLSSGQWQAGSERSEGLRMDGERLAAAAAPGEIVWRVRSPYLFVGGTVTAAYEHARWAFSVDGRDWQPLDAGLRLDAALAALQTPTRSFLIRATVEANGWIAEPAISATFQAARVTLPGMIVGPNRFAFSQQSAGEVRITHKWIERSFNAPPAAVSTVYPKDGSTIPAAALALRWAPPRDRDGDAMSDYHVQVSRYSDMRWPLAPTFDRLMSKVGTFDGSATTFQFGRTGLLNPDTEYYWRVRARDSAGLWGAWSKPAKFRLRGPRAPEAARVMADASTRTGNLTWQSHREGRRPVRYEVHGSNEEGFSPDVSTLMFETDQTSVTVLGSLPNGNYAFYRVIAIDRDGNRSPSTPLVAAPRPFIYTTPATALTAGAPFRYEPRSVTSIGAARKYDHASTSFWDPDDIVWKIVKGPAWLRLQDGVLEGEPAEPGRYPVVLRAWSDIAGVDEQSFVIEAGDATKEWPPAPVENGEPVCAAGITGAVSAFYDAVAGGDPQALYAMIHPDLLARIGRIDASEAYLLDALTDYQERMAEFGKPQSIEVVPLSCTDARVDLIALLAYPKVERVLRERITVVRSDTGWLLGRAR